jgi:hypothetical protein
MRSLAWSVVTGAPLLAAWGGDPMPSTADEGDGAGGSEAAGGAGKGGKSGQGGKGGSGNGGAVTPGAGGAMPSGNGGAPIDSAPPVAADAGPGDAKPADAPGPTPDAGPVAPSDGGIPGAPGLMSIFDGMTLEGWNANAGVWSVKNGLLTGGGQRGQATTKTSYENFRLVMTMRLASGNDHLGICLWGTTRVFDCLLVVPPSGAIYDYVTNKTERPLPADPEAKRTFHTTEILANRTTGVVKVAVNGEAKPDYKDPLAARRKAGPIGIQLHSGGITVEAKDIFIEVDPKEDRLITVKP